VGLPCRRCGRRYDAALFAFGRTFHCACGERVARAPRLRSAHDPCEPRFLADAMLGRLARWLRVAGYDTRHEAGIRDADLARAALREGRLILTRDRSLPEEWSLEDVLVLESQDALGLLGEVGRRFRLDWRRRAFSRCSRCNARVEPVARAAVADRVPQGVLARGLALAGCPECGRVYWEGSHTERMRRALAGCLEPGPAPSPRSTRAGTAPRRPVPGCARAGRR